MREQCHLHWKKGTQRSSLCCVIYSNLPSLLYQCKYKNLHICYRTHIDTYMQIPTHMHSHLSYTMLLYMQLWWISRFWSRAESISVTRTAHHYQQTQKGLIKNGLSDLITAWQDRRNRNKINKYFYVLFIFVHALLKYPVPSLPYNIYCIVLYCILSATEPQV